MQLDVKTLYLLMVVVAFVTAGVSFLSWLQHRDMPGLRGWGIGLALGAAGLLINNLPGSTLPLVLVPGGNALVVAGYATVWASLRQFNRGGFSLRHIALAVGLFVVPWTVAYLMEPDVRTQVVLHASAIGILSLLAGWEALGFRTSEALASRIPTAVAFGLIAAAVFARAGFSLLAKPATAAPFYDPTQGLALFINTVCLVAATLGLLMMANERLRRRYEELASTDELTRLPNRRFFLERGQRLASRSARDGPPACILMMDLDHFSRINRDFGHLGGDQALAGFAHFARQHLRPSDLIGRYGGEEFCVVLGDTEENDGRKIAERLRAGVADATIDVGGQPLRITVSIGVARLEGANLRASIRNADIALYRAKALGRNRVCSISEQADIAAAG